MARGSLRIYLGAAPGVGKTYAMLQEGARRQSRGTDVVVGIVETHGRAYTAAQIGDLEILPRREVLYRGATLTELDVDGVLRRAPAVVLVDELAHTNAPGSRHAKRWQDVEELLDAGIDVISTVNIQHLESLNDVVEQVTGIEQQEIIPDEIVRAADQVHLVDQTPEALRRRLAHGNVYAADRVDAALDHYFRLGNLAALRELALMWVADRVDEGLQRYREEHGIEGRWETRERVVVAITGAPGNEHVIRRAARMAARSRGELFGVHIRGADGLGGAPGASLAANREILQAVGGTYREVGAGDVAEALVRFARRHNATQIVMGASARSRAQELVRGSVINDVVRRAGDIDVHVITPNQSDAAARPQSDPPARRIAPRRAAAGLPRRRRIWGWVGAVVAPAVVTAALAQVRADVGLPTDLLVFTLVVATVAVIGGFQPAALAAVMSFLAVNWYFTPPLHTWTIGDPENLVALFVFLANAWVIGSFVASAARRTTEASRMRGDAATLAALSGTASASEDPLDAILGLLREVLGAGQVAVEVRHGDAWDVEAASASEGEVHGEGDPDHDSHGAERDAPVAGRGWELPIGEVGRLIVRGADAGEVDPDILDAFCVQLADGIERRRLHRIAADARRLADANDLRAGLLAALSHDLRTPIAAIQAAASTLVQPDVGAQEPLRREFLDTILAYSERLHALVTNLLEMSRIQADAVNLTLRSTSIDDVLPSALATIDHRGVTIDVAVPSDLPLVLVDVGLLERVLANLVDNACKWSPGGGTVRVDATAGAEDVVVRVVDQGPGIPRDRRDEVLLPFQRIGDTDRVTGTGLGLAVVVGFLAQMGGRLELDDAPGGGTTASVHLPRSAPSPTRSAA